MFGEVDTTGMNLAMKRLYHDSGRRTYDYIGIIYSMYPRIKERYDSVSLEHMRILVQLNELEPLPPASQRLVNRGEYLYLTGHHQAAREVLLTVLEQGSLTDNSYAIAANFLAAIAADVGNRNEMIYYLALSAIADTRAATREVTSLQRLGQVMLELDEIGRAHNYLSQAMQNVTEAHAATRIIQTANALPLIERIHNRAGRRTAFLNY